MSPSRIHLGLRSNAPRPVSRVALGAALGALLGAGLLVGCGKGRTHEAGLEWKNAPMEIGARLNDPTRDALPKDAWAAARLFQLDDRPERLLEARTGEAGQGGNGGPDSIVLLEYRNELAATIAFQELAQNLEDYSDGYAVRGNRVYFRRGPWIGMTSSSGWTGIEDLQANLSVPGIAAGAPYALPSEFNSLLHQKRVEGSERVLTREFFGISLPNSGTRIFAAQFDCQGDTAWIYGSATLPEGFAKSAAKSFDGRIDSTGSEWIVRAWSPASEPMTLRFSGRKMAAVEGCFDEQLAEFWLKMQFRALKKLK